MLRERRREALGPDHHGVVERAQDADADLPVVAQRPHQRLHRVPHPPQRAPRQLRLLRLPVHNALTRTHGRHELREEHEISFTEYEVLVRLSVEGGRYGIEARQHEGRWRFLLADGSELGPLLPALTDLPRRREAMDRAGVDIQILSSWIDLTAYGLPPEPGARYARMFNEALTAMVAAEPERFHALGTVPLQMDDAGAAEPVLPPHLFGNRIFVVSGAVGLIVGFAMFGSITYLPLFLQVVQGALISAANIHPRAAANRLKPFKYFNIRSTVVAVICRSCRKKICHKMYSIKR